MRAFLFPGQGSQAVGMGAALAEASRAARDVFERGRRGARPEPVPADARRAGGRAQADRECAAGDHGECDGGVRRADEGRRRRARRRRRSSSPATASANIPRCARRARSTSRPPRSCSSCAGRRCRRRCRSGRARWRRCSAPTSRWRGASPKPRRRAKCARSPTTTTRARSCSRATRARSTGRSRWPRTWAPSARCRCRSRRRSTAR